MAKGHKRLDNSQLRLFDYDAKIEEYVALKTEILDCPEKPEKESHSWEEDCVEMAAAIKKAIKESGMSREQVVDAVNEYYGWTKQRAGSEEHREKDRSRNSEAGSQKKSLSIHMFNHYLSKPTEYPIPSYLIFAIQNITKSLEPCISFAEAEDAQVISGDEKRALNVGKLDAALLELQRLKKELRGK